MGREEAAFGHGCEKSPCHSDKVFDELTAEVDATAQMYSMGMEKKEIADAKCRSIHTINAQLELAFDALGGKQRKGTHDGILREADEHEAGRTYG